MFCRPHTFLFTLSPLSWENNKNALNSVHFQKHTVPPAAPVVNTTGEQSSCNPTTPCEAGATSDPGRGEATDPTAIHFWSASNSKRFQEAARIPTFDCMLGTNAAQLFKNVHMHEWKEQKEFETQRGWRAVQLWVSRHLHAKREPWARKILTREHSYLQNTEHNMRRMHILQSQLLANSGEIHASRLAWLDRSGSVTCGGVLQEAEVSRHGFSHTVLPHNPIRQKTNKGFMFGNQNQLITEHCFQLKALVWE